MVESQFFKFMANNTFPHHVMKLWNWATHRLSGLTGTIIARIKLALNGCHAGRGFKVFGTLLIQACRWGSVSIGDHVTLISRQKSNLVGITQPTTLQTLDNGRISIGTHTGMSGTVISSRTAIVIGSYVKIGGNVRIFDHDFHSLNHEHRRSPTRDALHTRSKPISIGNDVFIGANAVILKGTQIGDRSIIGAGCVAAGLNIPPDSRVTGNPATIIPV